MSEPSSFFNLPELAGSAAFCWLILETVFSFVGKTKKTNGYATKADTRDAVREILGEQQIPGLLTQIKDGVNKLVTLQERHQIR